MKTEASRATEARIVKIHSVSNSKQNSFQFFFASAGSTVSTVGLFLLHFRLRRDLCNVGSFLLPIAFLTLMICFNPYLYWPYSHFLLHSQGECRCQINSVCSHRDCGGYCGFKLWTSVYCFQNWRAMMLLYDPPPSDMAGDHRHR